MATTEEELLELLEQIVQETVNTEEPTDEKIREWAGLPIEVLIAHCWQYVDRYLDALASREDPKISETTFVSVYLSGFLVGRMYEERRQVKEEDATQSEKES